MQNFSLIYLLIIAFIAYGAEKIADTMLCLLVALIEGMARLTCKSPIPILADKSAFSLDDAREVLKMKAADMINIKLMKYGGISKAREIIEHCEAKNITCMMGSMLEDPCSIKATAQLAMEYPHTIRYTDLDSPLFYKDITQAEAIHFKANELSL